MATNVSLLKKCNKVTDSQRTEKKTVQAHKCDACSVASHDSPSNSALLVASMEPSPHPVPLRLLHLLWLTLGGENQTGTKGSHSSLSYGLLGVPHSHKNVVKEGLHLLEEEGGDADGQLTENKNLGEKGKQNSYSYCSLRTLSCHPRMSPCKGKQSLTLLAGKAWCQKKQWKTNQVP